MKILDRYIGTTVTTTTLIVMAVLLSLFTVTTFVGELDDVGKGNYGLWEATQYVFLTLPRLAYQLFPSVALLGSIIGLGILASNSELLVLRASGVSLARIVGSVMKIGVVLVIVTTLLGEAVAPISERYAQNMRSQALTDKIALKTRGGFWARDGEHFVHIRDLYPDGSLGDISIYQLDEKHRLGEVTHAEQAHYRDEKWVLENIARSTIANDTVITERQPAANWESLLNPDLVGIVAVNPEFLSAWGLYKYNQYLHDNGLSADRYEQAFWKKITSPLATGVMVFLAIPFIFGPLRSVAIGQRVLVGTLVGIGFHVANQGFSFIGLVYGLNPFLTATLPTMVFFGLALFLTRRVF